MNFLPIIVFVEENSVFTDTKTEVCEGVVLQLPDMDVLRPRIFAQCSYFLDDDTKFLPRNDGTVFFPQTRIVDDNLIGHASFGSP